MAFGVAVMIECVLLDLDGVVRHFDPGHRQAVESRYGLEPGRLRATAFESARIDRVVTGRITRAEWVAEVGQIVGSADAAREWTANRGTVDEAVLETADSLRAEGVVVAILTNGTDTIPDEMTELGVDRRVDAIFNSAEIGYAKPDVRAFGHVTDRLGIPADRFFFTDDSASKLAGAIELGMHAALFESAEQLRSDLRRLGLLGDAS